ncbi:tripartite tricarboxylate transporter substrate binding protein [Variovorax sp. LjRoot175]|uniref:Bug family tripartite tricarboxylate transporter substrate binding protein n=1 Tax=Variovorax sp. LjRoot175 TaxID=3342276 RepID=UPI003ECF247C
MTLRRTLVQSLVALAFAPALAWAQADGYPTKTVTVVVPFTAGQSGDILARILADGLGKKWGVGVVVDNKPGAGGALGSQIVMRAPADGYTLLLSSSGPIAIAPHLKNVGYDPRKDFTPIMNVAGVSQALVVPANSKYKTVKDLIAGAKAAPGKLNYGSGGSGSTQHLTMELFKQRSGADLQHIPYKGSAPAYTDMLGGQLDALFDSLPGAMPFAKSNQVRILAVSTMKRDTALPDVPTLNESGLAGFDVLGWLGVVAPAGLSPAIRNRINDDLKAVLATEAVQQNMAKIGMQTVGGSPDDFGKYIASEYTRWGNVIKTGGIKAD